MNTRNIGTIVNLNTWSHSWHNLHWYFKIQTQVFLIKQKTITYNVLGYTCISSDVSNRTPAGYRNTVGSLTAIFRIVCVILTWLLNTSLTVSTIMKESPGTVGSNGNSSLAVALSVDTIYNENTTLFPSLHKTNVQFKGVSALKGFFLPFISYRLK